MSLCRFFALLVAAFSFAVSLSAIDSANLSRVLDAPGLAISLELESGSAEESFEQSTQGGSSLALKAAHSADTGANYIHFKLRVEGSGPGRLVFSFRSQGIAPDLFDDVDPGTTELIPEDALADTWYRISYPIPDTAETIVLEKWRHLGSNQATYYLDQIHFQRGVAVTLEEVNGAGQITLTPESELFPVGQVVAVEATPSPGFSIPSIVETYLQYGERTVRPSSFNFAATRDITLRPIYVQELEFSGLRATAVLADAIINNSSNLEFKTHTLRIFNVPARTQLNFEADSEHMSGLVVKGQSKTYSGHPSVSAHSINQGLVPYTYAIDQAEPVLTIDLLGNLLYPLLHHFTIRNLQLTQERELVIESSGKGSVSVVYEDGPYPGTTLAVLAATPEPGWEFSEWSGAARSSEAELELVIDSPGRIHAQFAQVFRFGKSVWSFLNEGEHSIVLSQDGEGIYIKAAPHAPLTVTALVSGQGRFAATSFARLGTLPDGRAAAPTFEKAHDIGHQPLLLSESFQFSSPTEIEIRNIVVSGGSSFDDVGLVVHAPDGAVVVTPQQERYYLGDEVTLSVAPAWQARFLGWTGDVASRATALSHKLTGSLEVSAIFQSEAAGAEARQARTRGSALMPAHLSEGKLQFGPGNLPQGQWTELELQVAAPVTVALSFSPELADLPKEFRVGGSLVQTRISHGLDGIVYVSILDSISGPFQLRIENSSNHDVSGFVRLLGLYRDKDLWTPYLDQDSVTLSTNATFVPIGANVTVTARQPRAGEVFIGWEAREEEELSFQFIVAEGEAIHLRPIFRDQSDALGAAHDPARSTNWEKSGVGAFAINEAFAEGETRQLSFRIDGPGALLFNRSAELSGPLADFKVQIGEEEGRFGHYDITSEHNTAVLIPEGSHLVDIKVSLSEYAMASGQNIYSASISQVTYINGYAVTGLAGIPYPARTQSEAPYSMFEPGTDVVISPRHIFSGEFSFWKGDLEGQAETVSLALDRHIVANASPALLYVGNGLKVELSENADFSRLLYDHSVGYAFSSTSGPIAVAIEIPALHELSLELRNALAPMVATVNGEIAYSGSPGFLELGFPVKEQAQRIELHFEFDPNVALQVELNLQSKNRFSLLAGFGAQHQYVTIDPVKEIYLPGDKVTLRLSPSAPTNWGFYDTVAVLPNLGLHYWLPSDGKSTHQIEIVSDTVLSGRVGPKPTRASGQVIASDSVSHQASNQIAPDGRGAREYTLLNADGHYLRIYCPGSRHVDFWIKAPAEQTFSFSQSLPHNQALTVEGTGDWQLVSLPIPPGSDHLSAFVYSSLTPANTFLFSTARPISGYGLSFVSTGNGRIHQEPLNGVSTPDGQVQLTAVAGSGLEFLGWGAKPASQQPTLVARPADTALLRPAFGQSQGFASVSGFRIELLEPRATINESSDTVLFGKKGSAIKFEVEGPGRLSYAVQLNDGYRSISALLNGAMSALHYGAAQLTPHELRIPPGKHTVEYRYATESEDKPAVLSDLSFEPGVFVDFEDHIPGGAISISPNKSFFKLGESYTLTATPSYDQSFHHWFGDPRLTQNPATFQANESRSISATFRYNRTVSAGNAVWRIKEESHDPSLVAGEAIFQGPGYIRFDAQLASSAKMITRLNGMLTKVIETNLGHVLPIPSGKHRLEVVADIAHADLVAGSFRPGWLFALAGVPDAFEVSPIQESYSQGAKVRVFLPSTFDLDATLDGTPFSPGDDREFEIHTHRIVEASALRRLDNGLGVNLPPSRIQYKHRYEQDASLLIDTDQLLQGILENVHNGPGLLSIEVLDARNGRVSLYLDGVLARELPGPGVYAFDLPSGPVTARWVLDWKYMDHLIDAIDIGSIKFQPRSLLDPFDIWMAQTVPAHIYAEGLKLGPDDDLDGDGRSNLREKANGTLPHRFDLLRRSMAAGSQTKPTFTFEIPKTVDLSRLAILALIDDSGVDYWKATRINDLDYQISAIGDRYSITINLSHLGPDAEFFRIRISSYELN